MADPKDGDEITQCIRMKRSADQAWLHDRELIREICARDMQEENDRILARQVAGLPIDCISNSIEDIVATGYHSNDDDDDKIHGTKEASSTEVRRARRTCLICMEFTVRNDPRVPCAHVYCIKCLQDLFKRSMIDETLMPPRCCQKNIPYQLARLTKLEIEQFFEKQLEYSSSNRLYCSKETCSAFIPPKCIANGIGSCPKLECGATTCESCKKTAHGTVPCSNDQEYASVLTIAQEAGWTRCYHCHTMVELTQGCYHMTCRCKAEFCYLCSKPWKTCTCIQWDERRLFRAAHDHMARELGNDRVNTDAAIQATMNRLRTNHDCSHTGLWRKRSDGGECDRCSDYLPSYLFHCDGCLMKVCRRCRYNR